MPTYHFRCEACGSAAERQMSIGSTEKPNCEQCDKPMQKIIVPPMVHFKGSGFYKTDSSKPSSVAPKSPTTPEKTETKPAEKKPEPKPAEKKMEPKL